MSGAPYCAFVLQTTSSSVRHVLVQIETAPYTALRLPQGEGKDILQFDRADLLEAIAASRLFADHMKDVALDMCTVHVFIAEAEDEPPPGVEPTVLKGVMQLGSIAGAHSGNIFVHVDLPHQAPASGEYFCAVACHQYCSCVACLVLWR